MGTFWIHWPWASSCRACLVLWEIERMGVSRGGRRRKGTTRINELPDFFLQEVSFPFLSLGWQLPEATFYRH